jgi:site-specific recombinase
LFASLNYVVAFFAIAALGGALAAKQPAVTAPALASKMAALQTADGLRTLLLEIRHLLRAQAAAVFGNLITVAPTMAAVAVAIFVLSGAPMVRADNAHANLKALSVLGPTPLYAALTGVLLWMSSLCAGFADNWFALRRLREGLAHHRRLVHALGAARTERWSKWLENHVAGITGNISLGILLGMTPVVAQFFGLPVDVRHVTLSAGVLTASAGGLGWSVLASAEFWLALGGVVLIGVMNVGVAFACALTLALRARDVPKRVRRIVFRAVLTRFAAAPRAFLLPEKQGATIVAMPSANTAAPREEKKRSKSGR